MATKKKKKKATAKKKRGQTRTYALSSIDSAKSSTPFKLKVRQPGWFPDGVDVGTAKRKRLFLEEVAGMKRNGRIETFPVEFDYTGTSKKWILGSKIVEPALEPPGRQMFNQLLRNLAVKVRNYNASLYRLRRLHVYWDYNNSPDITYPRPNPHGGADPGTPPHPPNPNDIQEFKNLVNDAETDWTKVNDQLNDLLETASSDNGTSGIKLLAADMIAANGYIVSMRVVVDGGDRTVAPPPEAGGSSSHVSISSTFSSSSQS
jgi:hypothetical protein